jgi:hypothetical protein
MGSCNLFAGDGDVVLQRVDGWVIAKTIVANGAHRSLLRQ